ncbi:MAG: ROK family protein [Anaerolineae bacterium]
MADKRKGYVVGVDLGGTNLFAAVVDDSAQGEVLGETKRKTKAELGAMAVTERIITAIDKALKKAGLSRADIAGVGVGVPGPTHPQTGIVVRCPNMGESWDQFPLARHLSEQLDLPVTIDNDVNVGAIGEHTYGAGRGTQDMVALFVGTGLGGGLILNGRLHSGFRDSAGEIGHMVILADGPRCGCGGRGHAEALASRTAIERDIRAAIASGRESIVSRLLEESGRTIISAGIIGAAYDAGDQVTVEVVSRAQYYLGLLIASCVNLLDPEAVVVGGGVLERMGDAYLQPVRGIARQQYVNAENADRVRIVAASLGDYSGVMGAAVLARQRLG